MFETVAGLLLFLLLMVVIIQLRNGTLKPWLWAKFANKTPAGR